MSDFPITVIRCNKSSDEKFQSAPSSFSNQQIFSSPVAAIQVLERQQSRIVMTEYETEEVSCVKVAEIAKRPVRLVRPMDTVAYFDEG